MVESSSRDQKYLNYLKVALKKYYMRVLFGSKSTIWELGEEKQIGTDF